MSDHEQIEGLHQRAAENYLQGQFQEALESWRALLNLDPQDDRAIEGIRLCELIVQQSSDVDMSPPSEAPTHQPPPMPSEGSDVDFDEIASLLKESEEKPAETEAAADPGWDFSAFEEAEPLAEGLDLADLPDLEAESPDAGAGAGEAFDFPGLNLSGPVDPFADATAGGSAGDAEVQSRIAELLSQSSTSYDAGDLEGAMTLLDRVFILDENNPAALALADAFRAETEQRAEPQAGDGPIADAVADENLESLGLAATAGTPDGGGVPAEDESPLVPMPPELATEDGLLSDLDAPPATESAPAATHGSGTKKRVLIGVGVVVALGVAGFAGLRLTGSGAAVPGSAASVQVRPVDTVPAPQTDAPPVEPRTAEVDSGTADPVVAVPKEDLPAVMKRARAAYDAGEFSTAVVAYNAALQIDPDSPSAKRGLSRAAAAYQEQREFMDKLKAATDAYERNDYREALRLFYRLPGTEGVARFDRFKANGWYNLGVGAMKSGSCNNAESHMREAAGLLPDDAGIVAASKLAAGCSRSQSDPLWYGDVERLSLRNLDD